MPVMRSSVYGWRWPRMRSQPSSCVRKCQSLRCLPCETTSACTRAPETSGSPSFTSAPSPTSSTSRSTLAPTSCASFSTLRRSPSLTRYCFPPVLTTAYIENSTFSGLEPARQARRTRRQARKGTGDLAGPGPRVKLSRFGQVFLPARQGGNGSFVRRARDSALGDDGGDVTRRRHVESGIEHLHAFGGDPRACKVCHLGRRTLLDGNVAAAS